MNTDVDMLRLLAAEGPAPDLAEKMMLFGQFIGSWDLDLVAYPGENGSRYAGEWHFGWVLDGHGIQDVLIVRPVAAPRDTSPQGGKGSTLRVYDPDLDAWWICWMGPEDREFSTLLARDEGDRIVLEGQWTLGRSHRRWRWAFFNIEPSRFRWECRDDTDGRVVQEISARRRPPTHG